MLQRLLDRLHGVFDKDPQAYLALRVSHGAGLTWSVADDALVLTASGAQPWTLQLDGLTLADLAALISAAPGFTVTQLTRGSRCAAALISGEGACGPGEPADLKAAASLLWGLLGAYAAELRSAAAAASLLPSQMDVRTARGYWLRLLGRYFGVAPLSNEVDDHYSARMIAEVVRPKGNNIAIELALEAYTGQPATVQDVTVYTSAPHKHDAMFVRDGSVTRAAALTTPRYGLFDVIYAFDLLGGGDVSSFQSVVRGLIGRLRAAGTHMRALVLQGTQLADQAAPPSDAIQVTGAISLSDGIALATDALSGFTGAIVLADAASPPSEAASLFLRCNVPHNGRRIRDGSFIRAAGYIVQETAEGVFVGAVPA